MHTTTDCCPLAPYFSARPTSALVKGARLSELHNAKDLPPKIPNCKYLSTWNYWIADVVHSALSQNMTPRKSFIPTVDAFYIFKMK